MPAPRFLVVDDNEGVRSGVAGFLEGFTEHVSQCGTVADAIARIQESSVDVVLCDIYLPDGTGLDLIRRARRTHKDCAFVVMSGRAQVNDIVTALRLHAADFLAKPFSRAQLIEVSKTAYTGLLQQRSLSSKISELSEEVAAQSQKLREALLTLEMTQKSSLEALVVALDAREHELCAHSFRVRAYTTHLAGYVHFPSELAEDLSTAALLHDIGKIAIPDSILLKAGPLSREEFEFCKKHTTIGAQILDSIPSLWRVKDIVRHHHERWDGTGYPSGLQGNDIPLGARIFTIADSLDALTSDRSYRRGRSFAAAQDEISRCSGTQFDGTLVEAFVKIPETEWIELRASAEDAFYGGPGRDSIG